MKTDTLAKVLWNIAPYQWGLLWRIHQGIELI